MRKTCSRGKHLEKKKSKKLNRKKVVCFIIILIVFAFYLIKILKNDENDENKNLAENATYISNDVNNMDTNEQNEINTSTVEKISMPDKIENYTVIGQLVIEEIDFEKYILNKTTNYSLNLSVTKLYGPEVNGQGNLCIIGHNSKGLFIKLKKLEVNDTFYIIDKKNCEKVTYQIYDKYTVVPTNLDCLNQNTKDKREVTLITCNPRRLN